MFFFFKGCLDQKILAGKRTTKKSRQHIDSKNEDTTATTREKKEKRQIQESEQIGQSH